ncbi:MAG: VUT family protein [Rhodospirillaceae bacterium]|nr:VUT family protein [Rhodospirillaceae bacterium]
MKYLNTFVYIALVVLVNWAFTVVPLVKLPGGTMWPPVALLVGFVFVARDFAQREIGHYVLVAMAVGVGISYLFNPNVAIASATAFLISELADWAVYSFTRRPLSQRILYSSIIGTPIDSVVFLGMVGFLSLAGAAAMTASKLLGALIVWWLIRRREVALPA